jgi:signal transduction protein with GAF and PtsI domain
MSDPAAREPFLHEVRARLADGGSGEPALLEVLDRVLRRFGCTTGTIHTLDPASGLLVLRAQRGVPPALLDRVGRIPVGKGMAGVAAERRQPVQVCNLKTDASGVVRPGARETGMEGSVAVPMLAGGEVRGVLGVAKTVPYDFRDDETAFLLAIAAVLGDCLAPPAA